MNSVVLLARRSLQLAAYVLVIASLSPSEARASSLLSHQCQAEAEGLPTPCEELAAELDAAWTILDFATNNMEVAVLRLNECLETAPDPAVDCVGWQENFDDWDAFLIAAETEVFILYVEYTARCSGDS